MPGGGRMGCPKAIPTPGPNTAAGMRPPAAPTMGGGEGAGLLQSTAPPGPNCCCCGCWPKAAATGPNCMWLLMLPKLKEGVGPAASNSCTASCSSGGAGRLGNVSVAHAFQFEWCVHNHNSNR